MRVLLADDDAGIRLVMSMNMRRRGWDVDVAEDGNRALERAAAGGYDVIVLDQLMPGLTGIEVAERLGHELPVVPVVIYSAFVDAEVRRRADELGCSTVAKAEIAALLRTVEELATATS